MRISANLGFLFTDLPLPEAIGAAAAAGFDAVECHFPYDVPAGHVAQALRDSGLPMLALNTRPGRAGAFGLLALPGREDEAQAALQEAFDYATAVGAPMVHAMAGIAQGPAARATFHANLAWAAPRAAARGLQILIEPINAQDVPGYFLNTTAQALGVLDALAEPALRLMFDLYHVARTGEDAVALLPQVLPYLGHVQIARAPDRGVPVGGDVDIPAVLRALRGQGYAGAVGAEYRPGPGEGFGWLSALRAL
ncbi:hydroxypyruvate isomerase family protein [Phaeovulum sp. W22_SRMD_FR3]|uniref:hydroxypyruvate isomerase family protein n=1 Tax=Phaeovulum sp. W22_SRMD_FR3 TaxID=3240274 RepID=UPI003F95FE7B